MCSNYDYVLYIQLLLSTSKCFFCSHETLSCICLVGFRDLISSKQHTLFDDLEVELRSAGDLSNAANSSQSQTQNTQKNKSRYAATLSLFTDVCIAFSMNNAFRGIVGVVMVGIIVVGVVAVVVIVVVVIAVGVIVIGVVGVGIVGVVVIVVVVVVLAVGLIVVGALVVGVAVVGVIVVIDKL